MTTLTAIRGINHTPDIRGWFATATNRAVDIFASVNGTPRDANASTQELEARRIHDARRHRGMTVGEGLDLTQASGG